MPFFPVQYSYYKLLTLSCVIHLDLKSEMHEEWFLSNVEFYVEIANFLFAFHQVIKRM